MIKPGQQFDFSHNFLCQLFVVRVETDSLDGVHLRVQVVLHFDHLSKAAFADFTDVIKFALK